MCAHVCVYSIKSKKKKNDMLQPTRLEAKCVVNKNGERYEGSGGAGKLFFFGQLSLLWCTVSLQVRL